MTAAAPVDRGVIRGLFQEIYLQDLVLAIYRRYAARLRDPVAQRLLQAYILGGEDRGRRIERYLEGRGVAPAAAARRLFAAAGRFYGSVTALLGTRIMMRIALSSSERAARRACEALGDVPGPDLLYLMTLRVRHEGDLVDGLRQHLIDTRPRPRPEPRPSPPHRRP